MILIAFIIAIIVVVAVFQEDIVNALIPAAEWIKKTPAGFLIPIAVMVILSIPPVSLKCLKHAGLALK